jgi:hypothetical protein
MRGVIPQLPQYVFMVWYSVKAQDKKHIIRTVIAPKQLYCMTFKYLFKTNIFLFLHIALYGCETWSLTLREERNLKVFKNKELRTIFGPKRH